MPKNKVNNNIKLKSGGGVINDATDGLSVDTGTTANKLVRLDSSAKLPAVDGSQLTAVNNTKLSNGNLTITDSYSDITVTTSFIIRKVNFIAIAIYSGKTMISFGAYDRVSSVYSSVGVDCPSDVLEIWNSSSILGRLLTKAHGYSSNGIEFTVSKISDNSVTIRCSMTRSTSAYNGPFNYFIELNK